MEDCLFCKIIRGEKPSHKVYEDEDVYAFLDINPKVRGHTLVVPKEHSETFLDLEPAQIDTFFESVQKIARGVKEATEAEGFNLMQNNEKAAGQYVDHVHVHIIPRRENDDFNITSGHEAEGGELEEMQRKISSELE